MIQLRCTRWPGNWLLASFIQQAELQFLLGALMNLLLVFLQQYARWEIYFKYYFYFIAHSQKESATAQLLLGSIGSTRWPYLNIWCVPVKELTTCIAECYFSLLASAVENQTQEFCGLL